VAVVAFKAVYTLEVTRRQNDKRILALYTEYVVKCYRKLMWSHQHQDERYDDSPCSVSFLRSPWFRTSADYGPGRLRGVKDVAKIAPDGKTMKGRMQGLCNDVAEDIKKCANTCDTYLKSVRIGICLVLFMLTLLLERSLS